MINEGNARFRGVLRLETKILPAGRLSDINSYRLTFEIGIVDAPMPITLSENFRALFYAPFYAAQTTGAFRTAGVEVVLKPSPSPPAAVQALRAGKVDVMWGGPLRVMMTQQGKLHCAPL